MTLEFVVRACESAEEAREAQDMDDRLWNNGYQHYEWLYNKNPELLLILADTGTNRFLGYVGVEQFNESDLSVGYAAEPLLSKSMPGWDHVPEEWHKNDGNVYHITGGGVMPEAFREGGWQFLMEALYAQARERGMVMVATTFNLRHGKVLNPLHAWGSVGMEPLLNTYDPNWMRTGTSPRKKETYDGSIIWAKKLTEQ